MIGEAIKLIRHFHGISGRDLSGMLGISGGYLSDIERGNKLPTLETLAKFGEIYGVNRSAILRLAEDLEKLPKASCTRAEIAQRLHALLTMDKK